MAIDPTIALGFRPPEQPSQLNMLGQVLQIQGLQRQNQLGQMQMDEARAASAERQALKNYLAGGADLDTPEGESGLYRVAPTQAGGILKDRLGVSETKGKIAKTRQETEAAAFKLKQDQINVNLQALAGVNTPEQAAQWIQGGLKAGLIDMQQASGALAEMQQAAATPQGFAQWKQSQQAAGMTIAQQMDRVMKEREFAYRQTNDQANRDVTIRGQNVSAATARRGQDMADARSQEANATQRDLANQAKQLQIDELTAKAEARERAKDASVASIVNQVSTIDKALTHPGRETGTGFSSVSDPRNYIPGTDARNFRAVADQISGAAFLQAFESLKGGGAITEIEGKKAEAAIARLDRAQSDTEYENALTELRGIMVSAYKRQTGKELPSTSRNTPRITSDAEFDALPSGAQFIGPDGKLRRKP